MKKKLRRITVDGAVFYWRFDDRLVAMSAAKRNGRRLILDWGWEDWTAGVRITPGKSMLVSTMVPRLVASAIRFALSRGWEPEATGPAFEVKLDADGVRDWLASI